MESKNWTEDFSHENGNYQNICMYCKDFFIGHKIRVVCKECMVPKKKYSIEFITGLTLSIGAAIFYLYVIVYILMK